MNAQTLIGPGETIMEIRAHMLREAIGDPGQAIRREVRSGMAGFAATLAVAGVLGCVVSFAGAVSIPGVVVSDGSLRKVQAAAAGSVKSILVRDGDAVTKGQILMRFDEAVAQANLFALTRQLDEYAIRRGRLEAEENDAAAPAFPQEILFRRGEAGIARSIGSETHLFETRRTMNDRKKGELDERIGQIRVQIAGLEAQAASKADELAIIDRELEGVRALYARNLVAMTRLTTLERDRTRTTGEAGQITSQIAEAKGKVAETALQRLQVDSDSRSETLKELREVQGREAEIEQRAIAARDALVHVAVASPVSGTVHDLAQHTIGGIVSQGEALLDVVPNGEDLVIDGRLPPQDVDRVRKGSPVRIKFPGLNQRTTPEVDGAVTYLAGDVTQPQARAGDTQAQPFYRLRVALKDRERRKLRDVEIIPGMPAELYVPTESRTFLSYVMKPFRDQLSTTFNEK